MEGKDQIIQLGKILRAEHDRGCDDGAAPGGLERFLTSWRLEANGALQHEPVQQALELLAGYGMFDETTRRTRIGVALDGLRALFRELSAANQKPVAEHQTPPPKIHSPKSKVAAPVAPMTLETPIEQLSGVGKGMAQSFKR
ncbi:MAG TPA: DNA helicase RecG, partial [Roseiflexaceae bacterium]|nr:DNA helicase RecG [Roseiflexaceae bacterium]